MNRFGDRLRALRLEHNILNKDFAKIMNVEPATLSRWEKGLRFPDENKIVKIAEYFDCSLDYLFGRTFSKSSMKIYKIDTEFPYGLNPEDTYNLINILEASGFKIDTLIQKVVEMR